MFVLEAVDRVTTQDLPIADLWRFLPFGYLVTVLIEMPILYIGLPATLAPRQKLFCGLWLTACTYPVVVLALPTLFFGLARWKYLAVAETFAPAVECLIFWLAFRGKALDTNAGRLRSFAVIAAANLASFGLGELLNYYQWFGAVL